MSSNVLCILLVIKFWLCVTQVKVIEFVTVSNKFLVLTVGETATFWLSVAQIKRFNNLRLEIHKLGKFHLLSHRNTGGESESEADLLKRHIWYLTF